MSLQSNTVSHWLVANLESTHCFLYYFIGVDFDATKPEGDRYVRNALSREIKDILLGKDVLKQRDNDSKSLSSESSGSDIWGGDTLGLGFMIEEEVDDDVNMGDYEANETEELAIPGEQGSGVQSDHCEGYNMEKTQNGQGEECKFDRNDPCNILSGDVSTENVKSAGEGSVVDDGAHIDKSTAVPAPNVHQIEEVQKHNQHIQNEIKRGINVSSSPEVHATTNKKPTTITNVNNNLELKTTKMNDHNILKQKKNNRILRRSTATVSAKGSVTVGQCERSHAQFKSPAIRRGSLDVPLRTYVCYMSLSQFLTNDMNTSKKTQTAKRVSKRASKKKTDDIAYLRLPDVRQNENVCGRHDKRPTYEYRYNSSDNDSHSDRKRRHKCSSALLSQSTGQKIPKSRTTTVNITLELPRPT